MFNFIYIRRDWGIGKGTKKGITIMAQELLG